MLDSSHNTQMCLGSIVTRRYEEVVQKDHSFMEMFPIIVTLMYSIAGLSQQADEIF